MEQAVGNEGGARRARAGWGRLWLAVVYAAAMGILEAVCVIYLRRLILPEGVDAGHPPARLGRHVEVTREACTLVMLVTVAWLAGSNARARLAAFFAMFGVWDILYYAGLKLLAGWPAGWLTWDCLFLIPKPWYGPVLSPVLVSAAFLAACGWAFLREEAGRHVRVPAPAWALLAASLLVWYGSYVKDTARIAAQHGYAGIAYSWPLFAVGLALFAAGFAVILRRSGPACGTDARGAA